MIRIFDPKSPIDFVGKIPLATKIGFAIPTISLVAMVALGIPWGLDFSGGTEMQVKFGQEVTDQDVRDVLATVGFEKSQVQQFGSSENHEMLIRIERLTSLTDENIATIKQVLTENYGALHFGSDKGADTITVDFRAEEGDRVTIKLPAPKVSDPAKKNADPAAITAALSAQVGPVVEGEDPPSVDDAAMNALSAQGFDRAAVAAKARELLYAVTASSEATVEPEFRAAVAEQDALDAQTKKLGELLDEKSGAKLRRTRRSDEKVATTADAIQRDEPYEGMVKYTVHFRGVSADIEKALAEKFGEAEIRRVEFVDAQVAKQLQTDGAFAVLIALLFILVYVAIRFDIFFSPGAVIALVHDAIGAMMLFAVARIEFELPSVAALLTVVGYSINNTIVIYDRIRETMPADTDKPITEVEARGYVNQAINDTFSRTINTSLTTLLASLALFAFAGGVVRNFAAVLSVGIVLGAFSSTFLAPATYLFSRKNFQSQGGETKKADGGLSREDKARGVV